MAPSITGTICHSLSRTQVIEELESLGIAVDPFCGTQRIQVILQNTQVKNLFDNQCEEWIGKLLSYYGIKCKKCRMRLAVKNHFLKNASIQTQILDTIEEWSWSANQPVLHYEDIPLLHKVQIQFRNSGTTCYANSTLNLLNSLPVFVRFLENVSPNICTLVDERR